MNRRNPARERSAIRTYSVVGALLGVGAPVGLLALRMLFARRPTLRTLRNEIHAQRGAYAYMTIAAPIVFAAFGGALGRQQDRLRHAHARIDRMRDEFAGIAAHDLRSPIATLLLQLDLLSSNAKDGSVNVRVESLERLAQAGRRLNRIVGDLLDATRIDAAKLRLELAPVVLPEVVASLVDRLRPAVGNHALELAVEGSPPAVMADATRLDQIVTNLVDNAAKYSPEGAPITIEIRPERGGAMLRVRDRGWGIPADELPHLFERYFQSTKAREKKLGLGLGLYITKGLVDAHCGTVTVESEVNRGSTFSVWLPAIGEPR